MHCTLQMYKVIKVLGHFLQELNSQVILHQLNSVFGCGNKRLWDQNETHATLSLVVYQVGSLVNTHIYAQSCHLLKISIPWHYEIEPKLWPQGQKSTLSDLSSCKRWIRAGLPLELLCLLGSS